MSEHQVFARCAWRLVPFIGLLYIVNFFDRVNVGFAALTMNADLHFSPSVYGFGAGIFFFGVLLFSTPSSVMVENVGARRWLGSILCIWGVISACTAFVRTPAVFYILRFALGVAEAGFVPGAIYYLSCWFPPTRRARYLGAFLAAGPLSFILGGPSASMILTGLHGVAGLHGWQWLFLVEGLPASILGLSVLSWLPDNPADAKWLSAPQKQIVLDALARQSRAEHRDIWRALRDSRVLMLGAINAPLLMGLYGFGLWLPQIVQQMGFSVFATGFISAVPYIFAMTAMVAWGRSSDRKHERIWHLALAALIAGGGFAAAGVSQTALVSLIALSFAAVGIYAALAPLSALPSEFLGGTAAAGGIGLMYALASVGGFLGPYVIGVIKENTGGYSAAMATIAVAMVVAAALTLGLGIKMARGAARSAAAA